MSSSQGSSMSWTELDSSEKVYRESRFVEQIDDNEDDNDDCVMMDIDMLCRSFKETVVLGKREAEEPEEQPASKKARKLGWTGVSESWKRKQQQVLRLLKRRSRARSPEWAEKELKRELLYMAKQPNMYMDKPLPDPPQLEPVSAEPPTLPALPFRPRPLIELDELPTVSPSPPTPPSLPFRPRPAMESREVPKVSAEPPQLPPLPFRPRPAMEPAQPSRVVFGQPSTVRKRSGSLKAVQRFFESFKKPDQDDSNPTDMSLWMTDIAPPEALEHCQACGKQERTCLHRGRCRACASDLW